MIFIFVSSGAFGIEDMVSVVRPGPHAADAARAADRLGHADGARLLGAGLGDARGGRLLRLDAPRPGRVLGLPVRLVGVDLPVGRLGRLHRARPGLRGHVVAAAERLGDLAASARSLIAVFAYTNIRGLNIIAISSIVFTIIIVAPFLVVIVLGFAHWHGTPLQPFIPHRRVVRQQPQLRPRDRRLDVLRLRLHVDDRRRDGEPAPLIPQGLMIAMPIVVAALLPADARRTRRRRRLGNWATTGGTSFVEVAKTLGGPGARATSCSGSP